MRRVAVGVVGLGVIAQTQHLGNLALLASLFRVAALADLSPRLTAAIADRMPGTVFTSTDWREVCRHPEVEAVLLLTPGAHQRMAEEALSAGKHVFSEKPLSLTVAGARRLAAVAEAGNRALQVGYMKVHEQAFGDLRTGLEGIGDHRLVRHSVYHPSHDFQYAHAEVLRFDDADQDVLDAADAYERERTVEAIGDLPHRWERIYRKFLVGSLIHTVSVLRTALGELPRITLAEMWPPDSGLPHGRPPSLFARGELSGHARVEMSWLWLPSYPAYRETLEILGTEGSVELLFPQPYLRRRTAELTVRHRRSAQRRMGGGESAFVRQLRAFHRAITTGAHPRDARDTATDIAWLQGMLAALVREEGLEAGGEAGRNTHDPPGGPKPGRTAE